MFVTLFVVLTQLFSMINPPSPISSDVVNTSTPLLSSTEEVRKRYKCVGLSAVLTSICMEIGAILWGLDMGFFGNGRRFQTKSLSRGVFVDSWAYRYE